MLRRATPSGARRLWVKQEAPPGQQKPRPAQPERPAHLQDEGQHWDEDTRALREQRQGAHAVHAQRVVAGGGDQPGAREDGSEQRPRLKNPSTSLALLASYPTLSQGIPTSAGALPVTSVRVRGHTCTDGVLGCNRAGSPALRTCLSAQLWGRGRSFLQVYLSSLRRASKAPPSGGQGCPLLANSQQATCGDQC